MLQRVWLWGGLQADALSFFFGLGALRLAVDVTQAQDTAEAFRKIYGSDSTLYLVYSELTLNPLVPKIIDGYGELLSKKGTGYERVGNQELRKELKLKPLVTYGQGGNHGKDGYFFRAEHSACVCEVRAAAYV